jgi:hypothetical protein
MEIFTGISTQQRWMLFEANESLTFLNVDENSGKISASRQEDFRLKKLLRPSEVEGNVDM